MLKSKEENNSFVEGVECLGEDTCYPLAFGVPASLGAVSVVIFFVGKNLYRISSPDRSQENLVKRTLRCIWVKFYN